ncbi:hypothetical protein GCM10023144_28410 [Pigmentiphaga soli]|uniref:Uncharacterized protein n=1 Tax=Pigmentiphaga soli TaxID=1007095 RepID=A0ABP8H772_9BURK
MSRGERVAVAVMAFCSEETDSLQSSNHATGSVKTQWECPKALIARDLFFRGAAGGLPGG